VNYQRLDSSSIEAVGYDRQRRRSGFALTTGGSISIVPSRRMSIGDSWPQSHSVSTSPTKSATLATTTAESGEGLAHWFSPAENRRELRTVQFFSLNRYFFLARKL